MIEDKLCAHCQRPFLPLRVWQIYCSRTCNNAAYYSRKIIKTGVDALDIDAPDGPSEYQRADRERRRQLGEEWETPARTREVMEKAEEILKQDEKQDDARSYLERKYGSGDKS